MFHFNTSNNLEKTMPNLSKSLTSLSKFLEASTIDYAAASSQAELITDDLNHLQSNQLKQVTHYHHHKHQQDNLNHLQKSLKICQGNNL